MHPVGLLRHLRALRSVPVRAGLRRAVTLVPDLLRNDGVSSQLVNITLELTYRCNIKCEFCFLKDGLLNQKRDELTLAEIEHLADEARPMGASFFLTGGEPFLRRDIVDIVAAIKRRGLKVGINTNGLLVTEDVGRRVRAAGVDYVIFSLHGPREIHDCLEGRKGAFDKRSWRPAPGACSPSPSPSPSSSSASPPASSPPISCPRRCPWPCSPRT